MFWKASWIKSKNCEARSKNDSAFLPIIQFLLPELILENFELISIDREEGIFQVHIEEKNVAETDTEKKNLLNRISE
ncbi:hypothetical protein [Dyadobacter sp. CY312]|uniref:hypothetical protein n=1 Tax=Dyadobacter sp. CY312 TaxID=2907303 RepID=UPI001F3240D7|nr:hypothetical protein [Dyadobacter sp. CY312]MCE7044526.1 hypothetical protein [Dyadobacter sp. CY312]